MLDKIDNNTLYICSNNKKELLLKKISKLNKLIDIKFMTIDEFKKEYLYTYNKEIFPYLMDKYNLSYNNSKEYLNNLYYIDINTTYKDQKLEQLKKIKEDLIENNYLIFNNQFKTYLKQKNIIVDYLFIDPYLKKELKNYNVTYVDTLPKQKNIIVNEYNNIYEEIDNIVLKIINLIKQNISLNNIYLTNINEPYYYLLKKIFKLYNIPLELDEKISINTSLFINEYFVTNKLPEETKDNKEILNKFINLLNDYVSIKDNKYYKQIIKEELKHTYIPITKYKESIKVIDVNDLEVKDNDYLFLLNFNETVLPSLLKDEDFLSDKEKDILGILTSKEYNELSKKYLYNKITNINNIYSSYSLHGFSEEYFPSSMIEDYDIKVEKNKITSYTNSISYNKRLLSIMIDNYNKYKIIDKDLNLLLSNNQDTLYNTYNHKFTGINKDSYLDYISKPLKLSYSSLNSYNSCPFSYYIKYVLKIDPYQDTFMTFIGNLYHELFSLCYNDNFNFEKSFNNYIENKILTPKESFLLKRLKKELSTIIEVLRKQKENTSFKDAYYEKEINIELNDFEIDVIFKGFVDKIMYYQNMNDTYYAVIDYKTGSFPSSLNNMKYGLDMQLAIYMYLIEKSNIFQNPIFTGCYFQKTSLGNITKNKNKTIDQVISEKLKLRGYSTIDEIILSYFDHNYQNSNIISGMSKTDKGFSRYTKLLNNEEVLGIIDYTDNIIKNSTKNIIDSKFDISPKVIDKKMVSCLYCKYRDLCFKDIKDNIELDKVEDLSFLGGDTYGN